MPTQVCKCRIQRWIIHSKLYHIVFHKAFPFKDHPVEQIHSQDRASHTLFDKGMYFRIAVQWAKEEECRAIPPRQLCALLSGMTVHTEQFNRKIHAKKWNALGTADTRLHGSSQRIVLSDTASPPQLYNSRPIQSCLLSLGLPLSEKLPWIWRALVEHSIWSLT